MTGAGIAIPAVAAVAAVLIAALVCGAVGVAARERTRQVERILETLERLVKKEGGHGKN